MEFLRQLVDVQGLLTSFGLMGMGAIVFAETGLLIGFFLPGDSLLFTAGMYSAASNAFAPLWAVIAVVAVSGIAGNQLGWYIGKRTGRPIMQSKAMQRMGHERIDSAIEFFEKHGAKAVLLGRFVPFVRTVVPVLAGLTGMSAKEFFMYNVIGGLLWATIVPSLGYSLGGVPFVQKYIDFIMVGAIAIAFIPMLWQLRKANGQST